MTSPDRPTSPPPAPGTAAPNRRAPPPRWRRRLAWTAGTLAVVALLWTAVMGWWLPGWLRPRIETSAAQALGTPVRVGQLTVQPWTLRVALANVGIGPPDAPLLTVAQVQARLSLHSLRHLAPVLDGFSLIQPRLALERLTPERFNFTPVLEHLNARPAAPPDSKPVRFALYNLRIDDGGIVYTDQVLRQTHRVDALQLGVPFVSNLPDDLTAEVQPLLEARIDGSPVRLSGHARPFVPGRPAELKLDWRDVPLREWGAALRPLLPPQARIDLADGRLDTALTLTFEQRTAPAVPLLRVQGRIGLRQVDARWPHGGLAWRWQALTLDGLDIAPLERKAALALVDLGGLEVTQGEASPARPDTAPATAPAASAAAPTPAKDATAWTWSVQTLKVAAPRLQVRAPGGAALPVLGPVSLQVDGLASAAGAAPARAQLKLADANGARLQAGGTLRLATPLPAGAERAQLDLQLDDLAVTPWLQALALPMPVAVGAGKLSATAQVRADDTRLAVRDGTVRLVGVQAQPPVAATAAPQGAARNTAKAAPSRNPQDHLGIGQLEAQGLQAEVRLPAAPQGAGLASLRLASLALDQLDLALRRDAQGRWPMFTMPGAAPPPAAPAASPPAAGAAQPPALAWQVDQLRCTRCAVAWRDDGTSPATQVALSQADLSVTGASNDLAKPLKVNLRAQAQGGGDLRLAGSVRPQPLAIDAQVGVNALDLRALQPWLDPQLNLTLVAAKANADGRLKLALPSQGIDVRWQGRAALTDLRTQDGITRNDFVRWRRLALDAADVAWQAGALNADLGHITLEDFFGRLIVHPDGHLNLADVRRRPEQAPQSLTTPQTAAEAASAPRAAPPPTVASAPAPAASGPPMRVRWQDIKLAQGRIEITDNFVRPNYSARLNKLEGEISAVSSENPEPARINLSGALDDGAPLHVTGRIHPLGPRLFTEIEGTAQGIELTRLSTYAERYAGYAIEKGSLSVTVKYRIDNGKLEATNQLFLDQLTFGDKVDSPTATKLPVLLAVALLKNSRGEIDVNLPVAGSLDDPQFSVGGIVLRLIGNLILKAVTAPFSLLAGAAHALAGDDHELGHVPFAPGSAELDDEARKRLDELATRLKDRPTLKLEATGRADPAVDADGLRERHVQRLVRMAKARATGAARGSEVTVEPGERDRWLEAAYKAADLRKPRNLIGLPKTLPPAEMERLLRGDVDTSEATLYTLANRRVDAVSAYLADKLGADRVLVTRSVLGTQGLPKDAGPGTRVQFELK